MWHIMLCNKYINFSFYAINTTKFKKIIYLWKKFVQFSDLVKHLVSFNSWFQISSQNLLKRWINAT